MLALSRVLTTDPSVVLLDEISMGLAPLIVEQLFGVVRQLAADGMTILLVEQLVQDALDIADYVFVLNQGRLRAVGEPDDVRNLLVRSYLGESESGPDTEALHDTLPLTPHGNGVTDAAGPDTMVKTAKGSRAHQRTCVIARMAADLRPVTDRDALEPCGLCSDVALPAAETSPATSR
jgi:ABC-type multidrug transport system ATPase subunit